MRVSAWVLGCCLLGSALGSRGQGAAAVASVAATDILNRDQAEKIMPPTVFFRGQSASIQGRNSAGIRLAEGRLVLAAIVDTSGYSSGIAERYQGYLITEVSLRVGEKSLVPGAYGFGFVANDRMVVMDLGGNEVLTTGTIRNAAMKRPTPLQILREDGEYRLYLGRSYVTLAPAAGK